MPKKRRKRINHRLRILANKVVRRRMRRIARPNLVEIIALAIRRWENAKTDRVVAGEIRFALFERCIDQLAVGRGHKIKLPYIDFIDEQAIRIVQSQKFAESLKQTTPGGSMSE